MTTQTPTAWPKGVIARYLTVGGQALADPNATVDITHDSDTTVTWCRGCKAGRDFYWATYEGRYDNGCDGADSAARTWAQAHAEKCRAMPKPSA
jgi:hypothetical protein